jgi:hypothetical protein
MDCPLEYLGPEPDGRHRLRCPDCGVTVVVSDRDPKRHHRMCPTKPRLRRSILASPALAHGPGTELSILLAAIGLLPKLGCQCQAIKDSANAAGVEGCLARRAEFVKRLQENYAQHYSWLDLFAAARRAKKLDAARILKKLRTLNPNTAIERLFDEAIKRAREKASAAPSATTE